ncbi:hypothetical protein HKX48_000319 [Thoreauomyces humboldtii]|nr:hypothetical protein HKX48_000319 [Thoreauomyces humboldtii]
MFRAEPPKGLLQHYKILSARAGVRVSPICLGTMNFGDAWSDIVGVCSKETSFGIMDAFFDAGGNFLDTAGNYQNNESEQWIGEWMEKRQNRDEIVLATKFTTVHCKPGEVKGNSVNYSGNHAKNLHAGVRRSLKNLKTDYIDILYTHWWDYTTGIQELMHHLNNLVVSGKVHYLGASDMPAWVVSAANTYARDMGLAQFVVYQGKWNVGERDFERDILPMARAFGMALAPWSVMLAGLTKTEDQSKEGGRKPMGPPPKNLEAVIKALDVVASELKATRQQLCIAYVIKKEPSTYPIIGGRSKVHLLDNIKGLELVEKLTDEHIKHLEAATSEFDIGFPHNFIGTGDLSANWLLALAGTVQQPPNAIPQI